MHPATFHDRLDVRPNTPKTRHGTGGHLYSVPPRGWQEGSRRGAFLAPFGQRRARPAHGGAGCDVSEAAVPVPRSYFVERVPEILKSFRGLYQRFLCALTLVHLQIGGSGGSVARNERQSVMSTGALSHSHSLSSIPTRRMSFVTSASTYVENFRHQTLAGVLLESEHSSRSTF